VVSTLLAIMEEMRNSQKILVEKPEGKRQLGLPTRECADNIKMNAKST
jgi:hypothetical protein